MHGPPPPYAMMNGGYPYPPNGGYYGPQYYPAPHRKKSNGCARSCCRCLTCFCCFFLLLLLIQLLTLLYFFHTYDPKIPSYNVESFDVKTFNMNRDSTLTTALQVTIRAQNPNKNIEFIYGNDSLVTVEYSNMTICAGKLPAFRQGHMNTTVFDVDLTGNSTVGPTVQQEFINDQGNRAIPVMVKIKAPINVVVGDVMMREFKVFVNCSMVLDGLSPNKTSLIKSKETTFAIEI